MRRCSVVTTGLLSTDHVASLEGLHTEVTVARRCADLVELIAVVRTGRADAVLIIGETAQLTETIVAQLRDEVQAVVVISDLLSERARLAQLGVVSFADDVAADQLAQALQGASAGDGESVLPQPERSSEEAEFAAVAESIGLTDDAVVTAVWGASGAPGRTTVAVNLAAELALSGRQVLLIDADSYAASVAVHLGLLEESAGIAQVCRAAEFGSLDAEALLRATAEVEIGGTGCDVLTGLPHSHRWTELRPRALERVIRLSRSRYDQVVVDIGSEVTVGQDLGVDAPAVQRNSAAQTVLAAADRVIAVGAADPVGFIRLTKAVQLCAETLPQAPVPEVVINKVRKEVIGRSPRRQLTETWAQLDQHQEISAFLPWDPESCDAALRAGQVLAEAAADSALRQQIAVLAGIQVPRRRRRFTAQRAGAGQFRRRG